MSQPIRIIIVGNGFGGTYSLKYLDKLYKNSVNVEITLVGEKNYFLFTPLLHEVATGGINPENIVESIHKVLGRCLSSFYLGKAEYIDIEKKTVTVGEFHLPYDYLILAPGGETNFYDIPGAEKYSMPLKSLECAIKIKNRLIVQLERASHLMDKVERKKKLTFIVAGGGPTGVELAAELVEFLRDTFSHYYTRDIIDYIAIILIQKGPELMPQFNKKIREKSLAVIRRKGIDVRLNTEIIEVAASHVVLNNGEIIPTETVIWTAGIKPKELKFSKMVERDVNGRILVNETLELKGHKGVFALGDVAAFKHKGSMLPALAQVAEKEARGVARNIGLLVEGKRPAPFHYHHSGDLLSLGQWMAVGELFGITLSGRFTWWLWRTVYLSKLISFKKKLKVAVDWTVNLFYPRDISQF
ncbi:MAG: NAD(P)/FAD-dependent oxidoreductase [Candidatus Paceibacterota bacterium]